MSIVVENVRKSFKVTIKQKGLKGALKSLIHSDKRVVKAVSDISFAIKRGESVAFLGPNGAGKSTTIKMMCGIMQPDSGKIEIDGLSPSRNRKAVANEIGVVFGQRSQLFYELRLGESFELARRIYGISKEMYQKNLEEMDSVLDINRLMDIPVRQLSLGQRMRGELVVAMLHNPKVLFLDEPTIGLDFEAKEAIRRFCRHINQIRNVTIILTTHDLQDVDEMCDRLMIINKGKLIADGNLSELRSELIPYKELVIKANELIPDALLWSSGYDCERMDMNTIKVRYEANGEGILGLIDYYSKKMDIADITITNPRLEDMLRTVYKEDDRR